MTNYELNEKIKILSSEINLKKAEISKLRKQIFENNYVKMSWNDLEKWLLENDRGDYNKNPRITDSDNCFVEYCKIVNGELQVGGYYNNDRFPRGRDLYVSRNFAPYRE